ncbi:MAG: hypothetical protein M1817_003160 [Caeruleum heppii]|nr:MAG: hypothetical protein M1817_003160 [Caeruleum heppii]
MSAADALMRKHEADELHRTQVEEVLDEEDVLHPPPSLLPQKARDSTAATSDSPTVPLSAKAAGKQKATDDITDQQIDVSSKNATLDTESHDLFPRLGAGPKPTAPRPVAPAWGTKKPTPGPTGASSGSDAAVNGHGINGSVMTPSSTSSRTSTPTSETMTPIPSSAYSARPTAAQSQRGPMPQAMSIPGRYNERITLYPQEMKPRNQLKKPVPDVLREINRKSKANVQMLSGASGACHFEARGPVEAVRQALKDVAKELGSKQSTKVTIPISVRPHIIGRQGITVQGISQRTGARIQVPKTEETATGSDDDDDDDEVIDVLIEGDSVAAEMARREIEKIVDERTSSVNIRLKDVPSEYYPFLAGPRNAFIAALEEGKDLRVRVPVRHTWTSQPPPVQPSPNEAPAFVPTPGNPIQLAGDRRAVQEARAEIERHVQQLRRQISLSQLDIKRGQHQFIIGDRGTSLHDFLAETGCAVVLPPENEDTETLTILGPLNKIETGVNKVMDLATSMQMMDVDISRQHQNAPQGTHAHARDLTRYLQQRNEIRRLEEAYNAHIAIPTPSEGPVVWEIYSRDGKNNIRARSEIINIVNCHPPSRFTTIPMNPFYHPHAREQSASNLRTEHGVRLVVPSEAEEKPEVLLVFEGLADDAQNLPSSTRQLSPSDQQQALTALAAARERLLSAIGDQSEITSRNVAVPKIYHEKLQRFLARERRDLPAGELPVQVLVGEPTPRGHELARSQAPIAAAALANEVLLRGPTTSVDALAERIASFVAEERENDRERGYTTSVDFPQKFANFLIGKKGENIRKYREEFDVEMQVHDGVVEIKGPKAKAEAAKSRVAALGKRLEDEATHVLKVKPQYHREMIGAKGSQVNRLQDRYNVRIQFPRSTTHNQDGSNADGASDAGAGQASHRAAQAPDEVIVRGPRKGADEAREELLSLLQWTMDNSHVATVSVAQNQIPSLIGQGGREIEQMRMSTGAQIDVPDNKRDGTNQTGRADIRVKGTKKQVEDARKLLEQRAKVFDDTITRTVEVDRKHHKALIGGGGANIRDIVVKAGGSEDRRDLARTVRFPRQEAEGNTIQVEGSKSVVDAIVADIQRIVEQRENQVTETVDVEPSKHRLLIGRGGETRRNLESQFKVTIDVPRQAQSGDTSAGVKLTGLPEDVAKAKSHISNLMKEQEGVTVQVPRAMHHTVSDNGQFFRRLRNDHGVTVDHAGQQPPSRSAVADVRSRPTGGAMPLITDDQNSGENYAWELREQSNDSNEAGDIAWILRGSAENVAKARAQLEAKLAQSQQQSTTGLLVLPDPRTYRFVIGPGGSQVKAIRKETGCRINVPRDQAQGEAIEILGDKVGVEQARDMILEIVSRGGQGEQGGY